MTLDEVIERFDILIKLAPLEYRDAILTLAKEIKALKERLDEFMLEFSDAR